MEARMLDTSFGINPSLDDRNAATFPVRRLSAFERRLNALQALLPEDHRPLTDKYFLNSNEILKAEGLNPWIRGQVFVRKGPGVACGIEEAIAIVDKYSDIRKHGGRIYALKEGESYEPKDTAIVIEAPVQDIMELETVYLGVPSEETTNANEGVIGVDIDQVRERMRELREIIGSRVFIYMGARHASFRSDAAISRAAFEGGADKASTDNGAATAGQSGVGTIPHALENIYAYYKGKENAVLESMLAYDRVMAPGLPRTCLCDYNNREIDDSLAVARALYDKHQMNLGTRIDTCGENIMQGAFASIDDVPADHPLRKVFDRVPEEERKYWFGTGVTVSGVFAVREALDKEGYPFMKIVLSSGFSNPVKTRAFVHASELLGSRLFDVLGAGELWSPSRPFTMDIVAVAETREELDDHPLSKTGREYRPNPKLELVLADGRILV